MNIKKRYLKEDYLRIRSEAFQKGELTDRQNDGVYTFTMIAALKHMAEEDVYPDGRFGDNECAVWSMFHSYSPKTQLR